MTEIYVDVAQDVGLPKYQECRCKSYYLDHNLYMCEDRLKIAIAGTVAYEVYVGSNPTLTHHQNYRALREWLNLLSC